MSQAPPAFDWNIPINTPDTVTPARRPPNTSGPNKNPTTMGTIKAMAPGAIISLIDALVEIATHFSYSGLALYSMIPGISRNCLRTSFTISIAALPTAAIAKEEKMKGIIPPTNKPARTSALYISIASIPAIPTNAAKSARDVRAAEAIANPFPVAAVVLPTASKLSVR